MLVECTVHTGGARFITTRLLASPVQSFLSKAVDFSLAFPFSSISTYRTSQSQPYRVCQTWLQRARSELRASEVESALWPPRVENISYSSGCKKSKIHFAVYSQGLGRVDSFQILWKRICFLSFCSFWRPLGSMAQDPFLNHSKSYFHHHGSLLLWSQIFF